MSMTATLESQTVVKFPRPAAERVAPVRRARPTSYVRRYNVLIASPSDVERDLVFQAVAAWNGSIGSVNRRVVFVPLMWEKHAIAEADQSPQAAINDQLLDRADLLVAIFNSRLGTPTDGYPGGTVEELSRRKGRAALFFLDRPQVDLTDEGVNQLQKLAAFKNSFKGFAKNYRDGDDLADKVREQLEGWSNDLDEEERIPLLARPGSWTFDNLKRVLGTQETPIDLHIYNSELACFRSPEVFASHWAFLETFPCVKRVVFLLPDYKVDRLRGFLPALKTGGQEALLAKFSVCKKEGSAKGSGQDRVSSSLAFVLACRNGGLDRNDCLPAADLAILSEPFSSAVNYQDGNPDIQWTYNYHISLNDEDILTTLHRIWCEHFDETRQVPLLDLLSATAESGTVDSALVRRYKQSMSEETSRDEENSHLIHQLRVKLFDPNVPSYLLNSAFELLDWNPAFELIFPTDQFYRNMSVKEFVDRLDNSDDVKRRGLMVVDSKVPIDLEQLRYTSPVYGKMGFTKIATRMVDRQTQKDGWIVALNVNHVEHLDVYEADLKRSNEEQLLISLHARAAERLLGTFPGHAAIVEAHLQAMKNVSARKVLDLGSGPGFLAGKLMEAGIAVTSVDNNDDMIEIARERCGGSGGFSAVKANIETLHAPNDFYDTTKIGIRPPYDGACMLDLYQWLREPRALLRRLAQHELLSAGAPIAISLLSGKELLRALNRLAGRRRGGNAWEEKDFEHFSNLMRYVSDHKVATSAEAVAEDLKAAGYRVVKQSEVAYEIDGQTFKGFPFLVAEAPRG
jgi:SAM-dependent methyltransferase